MIAFVLSRSRVIALTGLLCWFYFAAPGTARAQTDSLRLVQPTDSIPVAPALSDTAATARRLPSPRKALILSAVLPGAGQAYNRRYWKIPLVYIGAGILGYNIQNFYRRYVIFRDSFIAKQKYDVFILDRYYPELESTNPRVNDLEFMRRNRDQFRRYFELNIILMGVLYALNVVDANVDAHLRGFQIGDKGLSLTPALPTETPGGAGLTLRFALK
ncbi:MAG: hypothetical protein ICV83_21580 [Cytophagales bacterium]|nr:hypothetical protein [Cytophagales bacterium]